MKAKANLLTLICVSLAGFLAACESDHSPSAPVVQKLGGRLFNSDGSPAAYAIVHLYPVNHIPQGTLAKRGKTAEDEFVTLTDKNGRYTVDSLQNGQYNILGKLAATQSFQDSVPISQGLEELPPDTLGDPGTLTANVGLQPNHDARSVTAQVLGTDIYTNADESGRFTLGPMAAGIYRVRFTTTQPEYTPYFRFLRVRKGIADTLADTLALPFTGIPVVSGLKAAYDTLQGVVHLSWRPVHYTGLLKYAVFRDDANALELSKLPVGFVTDTAFPDTVFRVANHGAFAIDSVDHQVEYRVRVVNQSDIMGLAFRNLGVNAVSPLRLKPRIQLDPIGLRKGVSAVRNIIKVIAGATDGFRSLREIRWYVNGLPAPIRTTPLSGKAASDTLELVSPDHPRTMRVKSVIVDEGGTGWADSIQYEVISDVPKADAGSDTEVFFHDSVPLHGKGYDGLGRIVKWEWDIGATGHFVEVSSGDTVLSALNRPDTNFTCLLRVTDDDGLISPADSVRIRIVPNIRLTPLPVPMAFFGAAEVGGKIYVIGRNYVGEYDSATKAWRGRAPMPHPKSEFGIAALNGKIYVMGGISEDSTPRNYNNTRQADSSVDVFDPASNTWGSVTSMHTRLRNFGVAVLDGKIYVLGGYQDSWLTMENDAEVYDLASDTWTAIPSLLNLRSEASAPWYESDGRGGATAAAVDGKIYLLGGTNTKNDASQENLPVDVYDPATKLWIRKQPMPDTRIFPGSVAYKGKIYVLGGGGWSWLTFWYKLTRTLQEYDPAQDSWKTLPIFPVLSYGAATVLWDGAIISLGGSAEFKENKIWSTDVVGYQLP
jgi:N-acetylneuraminic acid mutarotase